MCGVAIEDHGSSPQSQDPTALTLWGLPVLSFPADDSLEGRDIGVNPEPKTNIFNEDSICVKGSNTRH